MPKHINSAYRVHTILSAACVGDGKKQMWQVFANVFGIQHPNGRKQIFEVNRMLDLFYDEIDKIRTQMKASNFSEDLYEPAFETIEQRITPGLIFQEWQGYKAVIQGVYEGYIHFTENQGTVAKYENSEEIGLLRKAWSGFKKVTGYTLGNEKFLTAGTKLAELGMKVAEHMDKTQK